MRADVRYEGGQVTRERVNLTAVRDAFYTAAMGMPQLGGHIHLEVRPMARDTRGLAAPDSVMPALDAALDGLTAARVLRDRRDVVQISLYTFAVAGVDGLRIIATDVSEPF